MQPRKTLFSIDVTEFGINTSVREEQPLNAPAFISVTVSGIFIDSRAEQLLKQPVSMTETDDRRTVIKLGLYAKAYLHFTALIPTERAERLLRTHLSNSTKSCLGNKG